MPVHLVQTPIIYHQGTNADYSEILARADEHGIELDTRDIDDMQALAELISLGADTSQTPYLCLDNELVHGKDAIISRLLQL